MPSEYKPSPNLSPPPNISPPNVLKNGYKPRAYIRDFTVFWKPEYEIGKNKELSARKIEIPRIYV